MCVICASIPVTAAIGAKMNASQLSQPEEKRKPIGKITGLIVGMLMFSSIVYHTLIWKT